MKNSTLLMIVAALVVGGIIGYFIGSSQKVSTSNTSMAEAKTAKSTNTNTDLTEDSNESNPENGDVEENTSAEAEGNPKEGAETPPAEEPAPDPIADRSNNNQSLPSSDKCFTEEQKLSFNLTLFSEKLESMNLEYDNKNPDRLQDCSGIFHRIVQHLAKSCDQYKYPDHKKTRASRALVKWYHDNGNLIIVEDPMASRNLIKPGSVMFFSGSGKNYQNMTIDQLCCAAPKGIIEHIGTVTEVTRDDQGNIEGYVMMHGRRPGKAAERSHYHNINPPRLGYPILGNWQQQWVAVANIMTPK